MFRVHVLHGNISSQPPSLLTIFAENKRNYKNRPTLDGRQLDLAQQRSLPLLPLPKHKSQPERKAMHLLVRIRRM